MYKKKGVIQTNNTFYFPGALLHRERKKRGIALSFFSLALSLSLSLSLSRSRSRSLSRSLSLSFSLCLILFAPSPFGRKEHTCKQTTVGQKGFVGHHIPLVRIDK